jgi:Mrp family chromosome partitioning ATPase
MSSSSTDQFRFEPTLFSAVRRYPAVVIAVMLVGAAFGVAYSLVVPEQYRASAGMTVPQPVSGQQDSNDEYLDSQVLLLQSEDVAKRATITANRAIGANLLSEDDFVGDRKSVEITPPDKASPGTYGASTITISFTWTDPRIAQIGANAVAQAFDEARSADITAQSQAAIAGIERAIADAQNQNQRADLIGQRTTAAVDREIDLARHPMISPAVLPELPTNGNTKQAAALGLLVGLVLGALLAFFRAGRRAGLDDRLDPVAVYGVPLIGTIPTPGAEHRGRIAASGNADSLPMSNKADSEAAESYRFVAGALERIRASRISRQSVVFISPQTGANTSVVVANVALALADGGLRVLVVDADPAGGLTGLLRDDTGADGFEQVLAGERRAADCIRPSKLNPSVSVLGAGSPTARRTTGTAYTKIVGPLLAELGDSYDIVLIDSPALLRMADSPALVVAADAAVVVVGAHELVRDHREMADRLDLIGTDLLGYVYCAGPTRAFRRSVRSARADRTTAVPAAAPQPSGEPAEPEPKPAFEPEPKPKPADRADVPFPRLPSEPVLWPPSPRPREPRARANGGPTSAAPTGADSAPLQNGHR